MHRVRMLMRRVARRIRVVVIVSLLACTARITMLVAMFVTVHCVRVIVRQRATRLCMLWRLPVFESATQMFLLVLMLVIIAVGEQSVEGDFFHRRRGRQ